MAVLNIDLGSSNQTIDEDDANDGDTVQITALGSYILTVDGVDVTVTDFLGIQAGAAPIFQAVNGANLTFDGGLLGVSALNSITYGVKDSSEITVEASAITADINQQTIDFSGSEDGRFTYDPALGVLGTGDVGFDVTGLEAGDQLAVEGRSNLQFSYDEDSETGTLTSSGSILTQAVQYKFDISPEQAQLVTDNPDDYISDDATDDISGDVFTFPPSAMVCFARGTRIVTRAGSRRIEDLRVGDLVFTMDNGFQPITWHGKIVRVVSHDLRPIRIAARTFGNSGDLVVSPQHRVLLNDPKTMLLFGLREVLVPAKYLLGLEGVTREPAGLVEYHHIMFDQHEIIFSEGMPTESFHPGQVGLSTLDKKARAEIFELFPEIAGDVQSGRGSTTARPCIRAYEARALLTN